MLLIKQLILSLAKYFADKSILANFCPKQAKNITLKILRQVLNQQF